MSSSHGPSLSLSQLAFHISPLRFLEGGVVLCILHPPLLGHGMQAVDIDLLTIYVCLQSVLFPQSMLYS